MERNSFSQRISKIDGNRKFGRFVVVLKLEFEIKNWYIHSIFNANISFTFQAIKNLYAHLTYLCLGCFVNFWGIFRYIWREIVFLKGLVKLMEIGNFEDLLLF